MLKFFICLYVSTMTFVYTIIRESILCKLHFRSKETALHNIEWMMKGGTECINSMCKLNDIPCEVSMYYVGHLLDCIYGD